MTTLPVIKTGTGTACLHKVIDYLGEQNAPKSVLLLGVCAVCGTTVTIAERAHTEDEAKYWREMAALRKA